ncbi:hypothetical protein Scep_019229 [Stephania cephalantha]|uniref:Uncharacterized protein n=1 Tax=Stephania cephalantha TaxID=152367 RepID=A0AAP0IAI9_9MAGN
MPLVRWAGTYGLPKRRRHPPLGGLPEGGTRTPLLAAEDVPTDSGMYTIMGMDQLPPLPLIFIVVVRRSGGAHPLVGDGAIEAAATLLLAVAVLLSVEISGGRKPQGAPSIRVMTATSRIRGAPTSREGGEEWQYGLPPHTATANRDVCPCPTPMGAGLAPGLGR